MLSALAKACGLQEVRLALRGDDDAAPGAARPGPRAPARPGRKQLSLAKKGIAAAMGVSIARISQIEHGEVTSFEVTSRYIQALGGRHDPVADFGDQTVRLPVSNTGASTAA